MAPKEKEVKEEAETEPHQRRRTLFGVDDHMMKDSWYGKPVEEVDPLIYEDTFCVIAKKFGKHYIYRFSSTRSFYLFGPLNPVRKIAIYVTTHRYFDLLIVLTILANCVTMAMVTNNIDPKTNKKINPPYDYYTDRIEYGLLGIYALEVILKLIAKGVMFHKFAYLRNRWNILDLVVVLSGLGSIVKDQFDDDEELQDSELDFLKTFRVLRVVKTITVMPGLKMMINALGSAVIGLVEVMCLTLVFIVIFSLIAQELYIGKLRQKCVIDKGGIADPNRLTNNMISDEPEEDRDRLWTEWVSDSENWQKRDFPNNDPWQCGNFSTARICAKGYTCLGQVGDNPDNGWTNFDTFFSSMLIVYQLFTTDYWEHPYDEVFSVGGVWSLVFFLPIIFLGAYYLLNLMLAVVAMSYETEVAIQNQSEGDLPAPERLEMNRRHSNFSFEGISQINVTRLKNTMKRTTSEKTRLAIKLRMAGFGGYEEDQEGAKDNMRFDDMMMNIMGLKIPGGETKRNDRPTAIQMELEHYQMEIASQNGADTNAEETSVVELNDAQSVGSATDGNYFQRMKLLIYSRLNKMLKPVVNHHLFEFFITGCIVLNTICLAVEHHGASHAEELFLSLTNHIFMAAFTAEFVLKVAALQGEYFRSNWNLFDMLIVGVSYVDLALADPVSGGRGLSVIRSMRLLRVFKLAQSWVTMKVLLNIIFASLGALGNLTCVLFIIIYIFAVMGMQMIGEFYTPAAFEAEQDPHNFPQWHWRHFWYAFMMVFRVLCGEWIEPMWDCLQTQTHYVNSSPDRYYFFNHAKCFGIYISITVVGQFVVLNLFLALLLDSFDTEEMAAQAQKEMEASGKAENIKNIVGLLMSKKEGAEEDQAQENETQVVAQQPASQTLEVPDGGSLNQSPSTLQVPANVPRQKSSTSSSQRVPVVVESPARRRFKKVVKRVMVLYRIKIAKIAIGRAEHYFKRKASWQAGQFLSNPGMQTGDFTFDYDATPESSESEHLIVPGDCTPECIYTSKLCRCTRRYRRKSSVLTVSHWYKFRSWCMNIVNHPVFEYFILVLIFASSITLAFEDIHLDKRPTLKKSMAILNYAFTVVFIIEMFLKIIAIGVWGYFTTFWTILDAFIVVVSLVSVYFDVNFDTWQHRTQKSGTTNLGAFKALRTLRALRPLRAISRWQGMRIVVNALIYAIPSIFNVLLVCLLFWLIFAIMGVQFFKGQFYRCVDPKGERLDATVVPDKKTCCAKANTHGYSWINTISNYDNVFEGYLSLLQIATFEGWMELMSYSVDATGVDKQPIMDNQIGYYAFYVAFIIFGSFFALQLFIGVIIDNFNMLKKKYEGNVLEMILTPNQRNYYIAMKNLGTKKPSVVVRRPTWPFGAFFYDLAMSRKLEVTIFIMIFFNTGLECFELYGQRKFVLHILAAAKVFFRTVYILEAFIKIVGLRSFYFTFPWNVYDFILVVAACTNLYIADLSIIMPITPTLLRVVRILRIGRVIRKYKGAKGIRKLMYALVVSLPALFNIGALLALITFIYAILGMALFGKVARKWSMDEVFNFDTFFSTTLVLIRLMTAAGWNEVLDSLTVIRPVCGTYRHLECGQPGEPECPKRAVVVFYIVSYLILTYFIVINLYIAIILENFVEGSDEEDIGIVEDDLDMFYKRWALFDPDATHMISFDDLPNFLDSLDPPLQVKKPNVVAIVAFNLPISRGNKLHCLDILQALIKRTLGTVEDSNEFRTLQGQMDHKLQKYFPSRKLLDIVSSTRKWRLENNAAIKIQRAWRAYVARKHPARKVQSFRSRAHPYPSRGTVARTSRKSILKPH